MTQDLRQSPQTPPASPVTPIVKAACELDTEGHCITCSDEALPVRIVSIDQATGLALVEVQNVIEEIDITLVDDVTVGDIVLVHGGVAIFQYPQADCERTDLFQPFSGRNIDVEH